MITYLVVFLVRILFFSVRNWHLKELVFTRSWGVKGLSLTSFHFTVTIWIPNTWMPDSMGVQYSNGKVMWLGGPFEYRTIWTTNRLFQSGFQTTIWIPDYLNTRLVRYSDGYCIQSGVLFSGLTSTSFWRMSTLQTPVSSTPRRKSLSQPSFTQPRNKATIW